ncbi:unnamed protein product [Acidocella sp. C78]|uniref:MobF family relaxase n=1 Tax=Acidocella sp. C78 TaxID=1671486 RepID=UPI00191BA5CE|nr:MobF family relaxase [Acidocella sp. C78]CAG4913165.1 unnamed protein product [Acidocella sp. C78]
MISYSHISSVTYYLDSSRQPDRQMGYYADAASEPPGKWWSPGNWQAADGAIVDPLALERLAGYRDTETGRTLPGQRASDARVATDYSFSTPKALSALWAVSDDAGRAKLEALVEDSVRSALEIIHDKGMIEARRGKAGKKREAVAAPVAAIFMHHTTREGDPQLHAHVVMMNVAMRADGTVGAVNNERFLDVRKLMDAVYTRDLAHSLERLGVRVEPSPEHGFKIVGQPDDLIDLWSKRRQQIVAAAADRGIQTKDDARQAQAIALQTRQKKSDVQTLDQLEERWLSEKWGADRALMIAMTEGSMPDKKYDPSWADLDKPAVKRTADEEIAGQVKAMTAALKELSESRSWWRRDQLGEMVIRHGTGITCSGNEGRMINMLIERGDLIQVERDGKRLMTSKAILEAEKAIVGITKERGVEKDFFSARAIAAAMADDRLSDEQRGALADMISGGGIVATQGGAGVGKTTASAGIKRACEADNKRLILASPEWRAAGVLSKELESQEKYSVDKIISGLKSGKISVDKNTVILIDEAGKMHRDQAAELFNLTRDSGAKIILVGDTRQMSAVRAGDPLDLVAKANPASEIRTIRRQRVDWMRQASMDAQNGDMDKMLTAYKTHGKIKIDDTKINAVAELTMAYKDCGGDAVALAATNFDVSWINEMLRETARDIGIVTGPDVFITAIPRGKGAKPVKLALATGDRLICGSALEIGGNRVENGTIFEKVSVNGKNISLTTDEGKVYRTSLADLAKAGPKNTPPAIQHAFCLTDMSSQGSTWSRTLWMPTAETARAAYVAATRHRDDLQIFVAKEAIKDFADDELSVGRRDGLIEHEREDKRSDDQILEQLGRSLARQDEPRNALDVIGIKPTEIQPPVKEATISKQQAGGQHTKDMGRPSPMAAQFIDHARQPAPATSQQKEALGADAHGLPVQTQEPVQASKPVIARPKIKVKKSRGVGREIDFGPSL